MNSIANPPGGGTDQMHLDEGDTDWSAYRITSLAFDPTELLKQAEWVCLRAQAAQPPLQRESPPCVQSSSRPATVSAVAEASAPWPPGRAGAIASFMFQTSYSPVAEVAIAATLGLLAGVCGRAYRTHTGKDLALYIILVAKSGVGKDAMHESIPMMLKLADRPLASRFARAQDFASGEALHKEVLREPGFLNVQGEFGKKLKRMANPLDSPMQTFRTIMLNAYSKRWLEGKSYSNAENSLLGVEWPALSFLGETTPGTFLECLTPDMMADGFLSRFLVVSYAGDRPMPNRHREAHLPEADLALWRGLVDHAIKYQFSVNMPPTMAVQPSPEALDMLDRFEVACIEQLHATEDESERQVWTRAHLKVMKIACLLAVADHYLVPVVRVEHVEWAMWLVHKDVEVFETRKRSGDIGTDDDARQRKLLQIMREYLTTPPRPSYKVPDSLHRAGVVPRFYLQKRLSSLPAFNSHRAGAIRAMDDALRSLADSGFIREVKEATLVDSYGFHGKAYRVLKVD